MYGAQNMHMYHNHLVLTKQTDFSKWLINELQVIKQLSKTWVCDRRSKWRFEKFWYNFNRPKYSLARFCEVDSPTIKGRGVESGDRKIANFYHYTPLSYTISLRQILLICPWDVKLWIIEIKCNCIAHIVNLLIEYAWNTLYKLPHWDILTVLS